MNAGSTLAGSLARCVRDGGVAIFPADTVYGLGCNPLDSDAVNRMHALKGRDGPRRKPAAVAYFSLEAALEGLPELGRRAVGAMRALLPGPITLLVANPAGRFPLAGGGSLLGVRVITTAIGDPGVAVLQSSANRTGAGDARRVEDVPEAIRVAVDLVIDGGDLPGVPSTVVDIGELDTRGVWRLVREGAVAGETIALALRALVGSGADEHSPDC